jgi:hypothetical protein
MVGRKYLSRLCFTIDPLEPELGQGRTPKIGFPQSALFPENDFAMKFAKGPLNGISPDSLLNDTIKYLSCGSASRDLGIAPD